MAGELSAPDRKKSPLSPIKELPSPNINPHPRRRKPRDETAKTMKFFDSMFTQFFARAKPDSTIANPRFIKKTNIAVINTHRVSRTIFGSILYLLHGFQSILCLVRVNIVQRL